MLLSLLLIFSQAEAREASMASMNGFRLGLCGGLSTECFVVSIKMEYSTRYVGLNINWPLVPTIAGSNLKVYPWPLLGSGRVQWRPYAYGGAALIFFNDLSGGAGAGVDIHIHSLERWVIQPSVGMVHDRRIKPAASIGIICGF